MILEEFLDLRDDTGKFSFNGWRCLICGEVSDPAIQTHRREQKPAMVSRRRKAVVGVN